MLGSYIKIAFRNIRRHKAYSFINIAGLAIGMACCIILIIYVHSELSFDRYHDKAGRIFRLCVTGNTGGTQFTWGESNAVAAPVLKQDYAEVENAVRFGGMPTASVKYKDSIFYENNIHFADDSVFDVFTWPLIKGNSDTALSVPYSIVLTEDMAHRYFGQEDPMGKILKFNNRKDFTVTGVMKNIPQNSHFLFDALCSFKTLYVQGKTVSPILRNWLDFNFWTYLLLEENFDYKELENKFPALLEKHAGKFMKARGSKERFFLQPLQDIYLRPLGISASRPITYVYIFSAVALFVLIIACINFMNLSTARSANRAREVGMRKVLGAERQKLIGQFLGEFLIYSLLSLFFAILIVEMTSPFLSSLTGRQLSLDIVAMPWIVPGFIGLTLFTGLLAGSYPAFFLAAFQPVNVLKGNLIKGGSNYNLRRILVIGQFIVSITLIIGTALIINQLNFMKTKDLGFEKANVVVLPIMDESPQRVFQAFNEELKSHPNILHTSSSSIIPGNYPPLNSKLPEGFTRSQTQAMDDLNVDAGFIPAVGIKLAAGRNFSEGRKADERQAVIINETAVKRYGWENPLGKTIITSSPDGSSKPVSKTVIGVVKDFHLAPLSQIIRPLFMGNSPNHKFLPFRYLSIAIEPKNVDNTLTLIEDKWKEIFPEKPFSYTFLDESFNRQFRSVERSRAIFIYFTFLAIFIACLGLFGIAAFSAEQRTKEIGIRKVLGSTSVGIVYLLSKELMLHVLLANIVAWPLTYFMLHRWLQNFPYRTDINLIIFLLASGLVIMVGLTTVSFQAVKAALTNPVEALHYE